MLKASISCTGTYGRAMVGSPLPILKCLVDTVCYLVTPPPVSCSPGGQSGTVPGPPRVPGHPHQGQKLPCVPGEIHLVHIYMHSEMKLHITCENIFAPYMLTFTATACVFVVPGSCGVHCHEDAQRKDTTL